MNLTNGVKSVSTFKTAFLYDFTVDTGAIGTYQSPVFLPQGCLARVRVATEVALTSGGSATIDIKDGDGVSMLGLSPSPFADMPALDKYNGVNDVIATTAHNETFGVVANGGQVTLVIGGATLTAGKFFVVIEYELVG